MSFNLIYPNKNFKFDNKVFLLGNDLYYISTFFLDDYNYEYIKKLTIFIKLLIKINNLIYFYENYKDDIHGFLDNFEDLTFINIDYIYNSIVPNYFVVKDIEFYKNYFYIGNYLLNISNDLIIQYIRLINPIKVLFMKTDNKIQKKEYKNKLIKNLRMIFDKINEKISERINYYNTKHNIIRDLNSYYKDKKYIDYIDENIYDSEFIESIKNLNLLDLYNEYNEYINELNFYKIENFIEKIEINNIMSEYRSLEKNKKYSLNIKNMVYEKINEIDSHIINLSNNFDKLNNIKEINNELQLIRNNILNYNNLYELMSEVNICFKQIRNN